MKRIGVSRYFLLLFIALLFFTSCTHTSLFKDERYVESFGDDGDIVVSISPKKASSILPLHQLASTQFNSLLERIERVSFALYENEKSVEGDFSTYSFYGGVEGNIPSFITNTALLYSKEWQGIDTETTRFYRNTELGLDIYSPRSGILLFSNDDYMKGYTETYKNRTKKMDSSLAERLANASFGLYIASPEAMIEIGLELPTSVLSKTESLLVIFELNEENEHVLGAAFTMESEKLASSLSILLKSGYISDKRRNKEPFKDVVDIFSQDENRVSIFNLTLTSEQVSLISTQFSSITQLVTGE